MGLHQALALCMDHCEAEELTSDDASWFKTVVLSGGTACLPGLAGEVQFLTVIDIFVCCGKDSDLVD